jgi:hypothetical protein
MVLLNLGLKIFELLKILLDELLVLWGSSLWLWLLVVLLLLWELDHDLLWNIWVSWSSSSSLSDGSCVTVLWDAHGLSDQIGVGHNELVMHLVVGIKLNVTWGSLWSGPERLSLLVNVILREDAQQVQDRVMEVVVEAVLGQEDASIEAVGLLHLDELNDSLKGSDDGARG